MSTFSETITLVNERDATNADVGIIPRQAVHRVTLSACVDTGSWFLVINEEVRAALGLELKAEKKAHLADGSVNTYFMTEAVEFHWKDRVGSMGALVIPGAKEVLFGALCMEALDLIADPVDERLVGKHGDTALYQIY
ncbi:MAG: aspartyl protease family protein [Spirochaetaceae bacterium]|jgi:predicted aspartyl protease|nr:aspartyl protease family protein [Spirochaetaceae bacterium]